MTNTPLATRLRLKIIPICYTGDPDGKWCIKFYCHKHTKAVGENNVPTNNFLTNDNHTTRDQTETENNTTIFYNHATQEIPTENGVSSFTTMLHRRSRRKMMYQVLPLHPHLSSFFYCCWGAHLRSRSFHYHNHLFPPLVVVL